MRASIAFSAALALVASFVSAAPSPRATTDCNPSYDVPSSTPCFTACNVAAGQTWVPGWTMDSTSPLFIDSLSLMCTKTGPNYIKFMTAAGTCMAKCTGDDPEFQKNLATTKGLDEFTLGRLHHLFKLRRDLTIRIPLPPPPLVALT